MDYNPTQAGVVLTFREGVTVEQAETALKMLEGILDHEPRVQTFDPNWGSPVFYIP